MPAELLRQTSAIHRFPTHAARTARIWPYITVQRSDERLNGIEYQILIVLGQNV